MKRRKNKLRNVVVGTVLALTIMLSSAMSVNASVVSESTRRAVNEYASWIVSQVNSYTGYNSLPYAPLRSYGFQSNFKRILRTYIGDGRLTNNTVYSNYGLPTENDAIIHIWSLIFLNNPYVEYNSTTGWGQSRHYGGIFDNRENYIKYIHDAKQYCHKSVTVMKADFKKSLAAYERKYGKQNIARKLALAANYCADKITYYNGWVTKNGTLFCTGGDMYSTLRTGRGICFDYSTLFDELCKVIGVECHIVMGRVKFRSNDSWGYHQWNAVRLNGKYFYVDPTNDDMGTNTGINNRYNFFYPKLSMMYYASKVMIIV